MTDISELLQKDGVLGSVEPSKIAWGHPFDWAADECILSSGELSYRRLKELVDKGSDSIQDRRRAVIVYVVADDEKHVQSLKSEVKNALDEELGPKYDAIIVFRPTQPEPDAITSLYKYWLLRRSSLIVIKRTWGSRCTRVKSSGTNGLRRTLCRRFV